MNWCFAIVNNKLAEIYFDIKNGQPSIWAHVYIKESEFTRKHEKRMIGTDTKKFQLSYRNKKYTDMLNPTRKIYTSRKNFSKTAGKTYSMEEVEKLIKKNRE